VKTQPCGLCEAGAERSRNPDSSYGAQGVEAPNWIQKLPADALISAAIIDHDDFVIVHDLRSALSARMTTRAIVRRRYSMERTH
jgi:hypothetical protein